jgi:hypothetical protein
LGLHKTKQGLADLKDVVSELNNSKPKMETPNYKARCTKEKLQEDLIN